MVVVLTLGAPKHHSRSRLQNVWKNFGDWIAAPHDDLFFALNLNEVSVQRTP
jgi:hypothetical protein